MTLKVISANGRLPCRKSTVSVVAEKTTRDTFYVSRYSPVLKSVTTHQRKRMSQSAIQVAVMDTPETGERVTWYEKSPELWKSVETPDELQEIMQNETNKMVFLDLYAGFCGSCKAAYPALCRIAGNPDFQKDFLFVKGDVSCEGIREFVKNNGIRGIPTVMMFAPGGKHLVSFGASFRKMNAIKANLVVMAANKDSEFQVDPNGYVIPKISHLD